MIPTDGAMLASYLNTKLRDGYATLAALCDDMELDEAQVLETLRAAGYCYDGVRIRPADGE